MISPHDNLEPYKFKWGDFGNHLRQFITERRGELESDDFYVVLPFKRGGSILAQSFVCMLQDSSRHYNDLPCIRDIPSGLVCKKRIPVFLNRLVASPAEFRDLPKLKNELESTIRRQLEKNNGKKLGILLVDDNITTGKRLMFFSNLIREWFGDKVAVKTLIFCGINPELIEEEIDYVIFEEFGCTPKFVQMPWHNERISNVDIIINKTLPLLITFRHKTRLDMEALVNKFKAYEKKIYDSLGLKNKINLNKSIFRIENYKDRLEIDSGSLGYKICISGCNLSVAMPGNFCCIPKPCKDDEFIIGEPEYRLCDSNPDNSALCYQCLFWYSSRDILYFTLEFLRESGMKAHQLKEAEVKYRPVEGKKIDQERIVDYLNSLYHEKEDSVFIFR